MNSREIKLTRGKVTLVDEDDYEYLAQWAWSANFSRGKWYARRYLGNFQGTKKYLSMHREIMDASPEMEVDHRDGDGLHNQKNNLRICTHIENMQNGIIKSNNTSGYKGVFWYKNYEKWVARIVVNKKKVHLGYFGDKEDAVLAYDVAAKKYY